MNKQQQIWMQNTALAGFGGVILSVLVCYAYITGRLLLSGEQLSILLFSFWVGNLTFIYLIASGASMKFRDGSLTVPQMVWAIITTLFFMAFSLSSHEPFYLLLLIVMMFGVFRLRPNQFIGFAIFISIALGVQKIILVRIGHENSDTVDLVFNWSAFSISLLILISLCRSVAILRSRLRERNRRLQEALEAKSLFLANMSHELRTPINGVVGMLKLLENTGLDNEQQRYLQLVHSSSESLLGIVNDVLDFSKIDAGKLEVESVEFDLMTLISDFAETLGHSAFEKGIEVVVDLASLEHQRIKSDPVRIRQIINNLTSNAIKFTTEGEIILRASSALMDDGKIKVSCSIKDTGMGIEKDKIDLIFESFSQADASTTRQFGGTGLGLAIVKKLCELMGGSIEVHSATGQGSEFSFSIIAEDVESQQKVDTSCFEGRSFLVIDGNSASCQAVTHQLMHWGAEVLSVEDAASALAWFHETEENKGFPDSLALLVSSELPDMSGVELCRILYARSKLENVPFVLMNPLGHSVSAEDLSMTHISFILSRPVIPRNLIDAFKADESRSSSSEGGALSNRFEQSLKNLAGSRKVLLVEDNEINQEIAAGVLEMLDLNCDVAGNGQMAIDMLKAGGQGDYLMVIMDCQMPIMDGYEATGRIRAGEAGDALKDIVIIAMTANAMKGDREKCLNAGMTDYLTKPIDVDALEAAVDRWVGELAGTPAMLQKTTDVKGSTTTNDTANEAQENIVWDVSAALARSFEDHERLASLVRLYLNSSPRLYRRVEQAFKEESLSALKSLSHELKGVAGNIGANNLMLALARLELACREENKEKILTYYDAALAQHQALLDELNAYLQ